MLDCDGWEHATAYHDAFMATVLGHGVALIPDDEGLYSLQSEHSLGWPVKVIAEAFNPDESRRANVALAFAGLAHEVRSAV